jgi:triosephosphate isomerase
MRNQIVAGNWKMNNNTAETELLLTNLTQHSIREDVSVYVAPAFTQLSQAVSMLNGQPIKVAAQNMNAAPQVPILARCLLLCLRALEFKR